MYYYYLFLFTILQAFAPPLAHNADKQRYKKKLTSLKKNIPSAGTAYFSCHSAPRKSIQKNEKKVKFCPFFAQETPPENQHLTGTISYSTPTHLLTIALSSFSRVRDDKSYYRQ
jgi:hypothetical protein